jgi:hypothetical protein
MQAEALSSPYPHPDLQPLEPIQSVNPLLVDRPALPAQHHVNALKAEPWPALGNLADPHPQRCLIASRAFAVPPRSTDPSEPTRPDPADPEALQDPLHEFLAA